MGPAKGVSFRPRPPAVSEDAKRSSLPDANAQEAAAKGHSKQFKKICRWKVIFNSLWS